MVRTGRSRQVGWAYRHLSKAISSGLVPDEQVVKVFDGGTYVVVVHEGIPDGVPAADNAPFSPSRGYPMYPEPEIDG